MPPALSPTGFDCKRALDVEARLVSDRGPGLSPFTRLSLFYFNKSDFSRIHRISPRETKIITQRTTLSMKFRMLPPFRRKQTYSGIQKPVQWTGRQPAPAPDFTHARGCVFACTVFTFRIATAV